MEVVGVMAPVLPLKNHQGFFKKIYQPDILHLVIYRVIFFSFGLNLLRLNHA